MNLKKDKKGRIAAQAVLVLDVSWINKAVDSGDEVTHVIPVANFSLFSFPICIKFAFLYFIVLLFILD